MKKYFYFGFLSFVVFSWSVVVNAQDVCSMLIPRPVSVKIVDTATLVRRNVRTIFDKKMAPESYSIVTKGNTIVVRAADKSAVIWANRTLDQLADPHSGATPQFEIFDAPAFSFRGFMHDTGRNFMEISLLKRHIDLLSAYKLNIFQWHLTDNPGWRIECKAYPVLNDPKHHTRDFGKFYTYDQIREVIAYAKERGVMIVPEIDIPGHSAYFKRAFGFDMASDEGQKVLEKCFAEFFAEISVKDCPYIHIGSDEVRIANPVEFMRWAQDMVTSAGRQVMVWDPGLKADQTVIRQLWGPAAGNAKAKDPANGPFVDSYFGYLNLEDPIFFVRKIYDHRVAEGAQGGVLCLWNDVRSDDKELIEEHNGMLPAMLAFAERFWCGKRDMGDFGQFEDRMVYHRDNFLSAHSFRYVKNSNIRWDVTINDTLKFEAVGGAIDIGRDCYSKGGLKPEAGMRAEMKTVLSVDADTVIKAWIGFDAPIRSNRISDGIAPVGKWENEGNMFVNGIRVEPPVRTQAGKYRFHFNTWFTPENEKPFTAEQMYWMREPVEIHLKKGENTVHLIAPMLYNWQRWVFAFIPIEVTPEGGFSEPKGIRFVR